MKTHLLLLSASLALGAGAAPALARGTAFTYQGRLTDGASPANGSYDFLFELYADAAGASRVGGALTNPAAPVANGLFTATLDFGPGSLPGADRWLGVGVRATGGGAFTALTPLQKLTPAPYAVTAASAAGLSGAVIAGGGYNHIDTLSSNSVIGGGITNLIQDSAAASTIGGGSGNLIQTAAGDSTIAGGEDNVIVNNANDATIGGGKSNTAGGPSETIGGGEFNSADGYAATIPGGAGNTATGDYSFAAGDNAAAADTGSFVWADSIGYPFSSSAANEFAVRATGGVRFVSGVDASGNLRAGVSLAAGGGSWSSLSDRDSKENLVAVDARQVLEHLAQLPIATWNYKSQDPTVRHIGPMAQDFFTAFAVGEDQRHITGIDADGVALAAVQGLNRKLEASLAEKEAQILELRQALAQLKQQFERLSK